MTRQEMIERAAKDGAAAADYSLVGTADMFGDAITAEQVQANVESAIERLTKVLNETDAEWDAKWAASAAEEDRIEADAWAFAAGKG